MPGERTPDQSDSTMHSGQSTDNDISLREHMQRQIDAQRVHLERIVVEHRTQLDERWLNQEASVKNALTAVEKAVEKAEHANDKRFESVNEFRAQLSDQTNTFMPRAESIQRHDNNQARLNDLEKRMSEALATINSRLDRTAGNSQGIDKAWGYLIGLVGLLGGLVALIIAMQ